MGGHWHLRVFLFFCFCISQFLFWYLFCQSADKCKDRAQKSVQSSASLGFIFGFSLNSPFQLNRKILSPEYIELARQKFHQVAQLPREKRKPGILTFVFLVVFSTNLVEQEHICGLRFISYLFFLNFFYEGNGRLGRHSPRDKACKKR